VADLAACASTSTDGEMRTNHPGSNRKRTTVALDDVLLGKAQALPALAKRPPWSRKHRQPLWSVKAPVA